MNANVFRGPGDGGAGWPAPADGRRGGGTTPIVCVLPSPSQPPFSTWQALLRSAHLTLRSTPLMFSSVTFFLLATLSFAQPTPPVPNPARPAPFWSWDTVPRAYHGANRSGLFSADGINALSNYSMVAIEKWYTPCGAQHPAQSGPSCAVEDKMFEVFTALKALHPEHTNIMYLNTMFDFAFYRLNGIILAREAAGEKLLLRDMHGTLVQLCNDGNVYCNVTNFDWTVPAMLDLWLEAVTNATTSGGVDGIFADHLQSSIDTTMSPPQLCNGKDPLRMCWNFTVPFANAFNAAHAWLGNKTQDTLSKLPGKGPVVDGPYASWSSTFPACDYAKLRAAVLAGQAGDGPFVLEANHGDDCTPDDSCIANFLAAAEEYTYLTCFADDPVASQGNQFAYPLGPPTGPPVEKDGIVTRSFLGPGGLTNASVDLASGKGVMQWVGQTPAPPPPPAGPCGYLPLDTAIACCDVAVHPNTTSPGACCDLCTANDKCAMWCFHGEVGEHYQECHLHSKEGQAHPLAGATSGVLVRSPSTF